MKIPEKGMDKDTLFQTMEAYRADDMKVSGRTWGYVYDAGLEVDAVSKQAYTRFLSENALDPTVYPSMLRFETELAAMAASHLNGDEEVVGNFTSGGTESIILAVKAARDYAREKRPEVREPELILPVTGHASFHKAAHYLGLRLVQVPVDPVSFKANVEAFRRAITPNTILLVGSAPCYSHGVIDPIRDLGRLAEEHGLLFHVDACIGGFLLPYFRRLGAPVPDFDFRIPGVTSISVDLHKYAYAAKGASLILYRNRALRKYQIFSCSRWTGYICINNAIQSSKSGGPIAAAWAVLNYIGDGGYLKIARRLMEATRRLVEGIERIEGLRVVVPPEMSLITVTSDTINVFHIIDEMKERGWYIQAQLGFGGHKENIHLSVNPSNVEWVDTFLEDLRASVEAARALPSGDLAPVVQNLFSSIDPADLTTEMLLQLLEMAGIKGFGLPERMAEINEILNALPPEFTERLLTEFVNELFCYSPPTS
jgi:glutamate/tyrosine decarboxylase-like PLP-dependent enzyme